METVGRFFVMCAAWCSFLTACLIPIGARVLYVSTSFFVDEPNKYQCDRIGGGTAALVAGAAALMLFFFFGGIELYSRASKK